MQYDIPTIERKWQQRFEQDTSTYTRPTGSGKKYYCLDMFPYPSGSGLHVGHWRGYVLSDVYARLKWLQGYNVLHPMGWDAFGLPAENDALKKKSKPQTSTALNIAHFKKQLKEIGALYDWSKEINTTDPNYYKWTQWIFLHMYKAGLAYEGFMPINWCSSCLTGLANEEVIQGNCERCGTRVEQREIRQWVLRITEYAEKLLNDLDTLEWPEKVKTMQRNWIGRSEGVIIRFELNNLEKTIIHLPVYTTMPATIFGVTFLAMAPDHDLVSHVIPADKKEAVADYQALTKTMSSFERQLDKDKTGIFSGCYATNPATGQLIPIYLANYVLKEYGTGVIMGVPGHDERDFYFAKKYDIPCKQVVDGPGVKLDSDDELYAPYTGDGRLINSGDFNGYNVFTDGARAITEWLVKKEVASPKITYRLRDWIFSRQRYWGEPIPLIHCPECGIVPVPEDQLPVLLPDVDKYEPTGTGESPLAAISSWVNTPCPRCNQPAKRETNTMPQWAGSCWYFLRYPNPHLTDKPWDTFDIDYWLPVDLYVGGIEHAILHLLYARFYVKVLYDLGYLPFNEPFTRLFNQGMILKLSNITGQVEKMSKSKGNVVNPDEIVHTYGSDALRMYILFMGPPELDCEWQDTGLEGVKRFLNRFWAYMTTPEHIAPVSQPEKPAVTRRVHQFMRDFQQRIDAFKPNTAVSAAMELLNDLHAHTMQISMQSAEQIVVMLSLIIPHMASELLEHLFNKRLADCTWPDYDNSLVIDHTVSIVVQVQGKVRATIIVARDTPQAEVQPQAQEAVAKWLAQGDLINVIFIPNRLINFVIT